MHPNSRQERIRDLHSINPTGPRTRYIHIPLCLQHFEWLGGNVGRVENENVDGVMKPMEERRGE